MAADQRKRRLNGTSVVDCSSRELYRAKKKNLGSEKYDLNMRPHISLEWNGSQKRVVAKREQISISRRDLTPFIDFVPHCQNILADVSAIPREMFELENLAEVLSYEVWQSHLSEKERNLLTQFLPKGADAQQVVQQLLGGDNFHFGNPFLKWGASLCSGNLHPDAVFRQEQYLKANKKAYYSDLQKYHNDMIGNLQKWKERWASCKDPEKEFVQNLSRSRKHIEKKISAPEDDSRFHDPEENLEATSESCSLVAEEKACSSDNQNSSMMKGGELHKRKGFMDKYQNSLAASDDVLKVVARPRKGEKLKKRNIHCSDGAKYMSYFKISKKQHQLVKSMKQSGKSIQSRSLNRVLGDLDRFHIQPYEVFEEEERKKLHEHWLQVANRDLPVAFENWRKRQSQRWQMTKSLEQEIEEKLKSLVEDEEEEEEEEEEVEEENSDTMPQEQKISEGADDESTTEDDEESVPGSIQNQPLHSLNASHETDPMEMDSEDNHVISKPNDSPPEMDSEDNRVISKPIDSPPEMDSEGNNVISKSNDSPPDISEYSGNLNSTDAAISRGVPTSSAGDVWPAVSLPQSFYHSTSSHEYTSASELSLGHPQVLEEHQTQLIDMESEIREDRAEENILHRRSNDGAFSSYQNPNQNELLRSFLKGPGTLSYHHEQKQTGLDFQPTNNILMETRQFPGQFRDQLQPPLLLEQRHKRQNELYINQNIQENMYSDGGRYFIPRQEHLPPINMQDWAVNPVRMSAPLQSQSNGGELLSQNWFSSEHRVRGGWSGSDGACIPSQSLGNGSNTDESLFSVLSHCNDLRPGTAPYNSMGSTEQFISSRNFGVMGGGIPRNSNVLPQAAHPLDYLSGREAATSLMTNNMGWVGLPHQNSSLHDSMGKPFLRSWNQ